MELQRGQKLKLSDLTAAHQISIHVSVAMQEGAADVTCFGVDGKGMLSDDRYFIFYNQMRSPDDAIVMKESPEGTVFVVDLDKLPPQIEKLVVTAASDGGAQMRDIRSGKVMLDAGGNTAEFRFSGEGFDQEKALILCELYQKNGVWRYSIVASGFNGGLSALLSHFGGKEAAPAPTQAPVPKPAPAPNPAPPDTPKVNLSKITLKKSGDTHKIDLSKNTGEIHVNLNWNQGRKKLFGSKAVDLDLACMYRLKDGSKGVIQALGNSFGSANQPPFIFLDQDDRTGTSAGGENMLFKRPDLIEEAVVFAYIYEGVPNWRGTDAAVLLQQKGAPDIEIRIDNPNAQHRFCVLAALSGQHGTLEVKREERYFAGHKAIDEHYHFGFRWVAAKK